MLLAFDVGNTNIVCGVYKERKLIRHWRVATDTLQTADGYAALLGTLFQLVDLPLRTWKTLSSPPWFRQSFRFWKP